MFVTIKFDFNAKIGTAHELYPETVGKFGKGKLNANGERRVEMAVKSNLIVTNTMFYHRFGHRATWVTTEKNKRSWDGRPRRNTIRNQIDFMMVHKRYKQLS